MFQYNIGQKVRYKLVGGMYVPLSPSYDHVQTEPSQQLFVYFHCNLVGQLKMHSF